MPRPADTEEPRILDGQSADRAAIRELIQSWAIWRDSGAWDRLASVWHEDGQMVATWYQGPAEEFVRRSRAAWEAGARVVHSLSGTSIDVSGSRAIAQTRMTISLRTEVHGVVCDVTCTGRFHDFFECREGRWGLVSRHVIYDKDRLDPVGAQGGDVGLHLDAAVLGRYPEGYRYLAYAQARQGLRVDPELPCTGGPAAEALVARSRVWLAEQSEL